MSKVESIIKKYRALAQIPALISANLSQNGTAVNSVWSQRNLERKKTTKAFVQHVLDTDLNVTYECPAIDISAELLSKISASGIYRAVVREFDNKEGRKQFLEVWENRVLIRCVDLFALEVHLDVYADVEFSALEWSPDETKLLYVAEKKLPKYEPFYKRKPNSDKDDDNLKGKEYVFREDWGEQLVGKKQSVLAMYDIQNDCIKILEGVPEGVCPAQPVWGLDGTQIFGIALKTSPRKLGLIYCSNRLSSIFSLDLQGNYVEMLMNNKSVKGPKITLNGKELIWLQREAGGPHYAAMSLMKTKIPISETSEPQVVVDIVQTDIDIDSTKFYGLYSTKLSNRCWANDGRLLLSTNQMNSINSYVIDIDSGSIIELPYAEGSQVILDVHNDIILVLKRNFFTADKLAIGKLPSIGDEKSIEWTDITISKPVDGLEHCTHQYLDLHQDTVEVVNKFSAIYLGPKAGTEKGTPLIVWPHGGPHSGYANGFMLEASLFLSFGYAILLVNYRGSIGAGQKSVDYLLGRIGKSDVSDCVLATKVALDKFAWLDKNRIVLIGGSHGGFLVTHLSGQHPDMFKTVVARNPVIDVASMSITSDIPDWCYVEAGAEYNQAGEPDSELLLAMRKASPIQHAHKVKAPTLLQIGSKDLRVPPSQACEYYHRLKANGVKVQMNLYEDNHPLGAVANEMDNLINTVIWINDHLD